MTVRRHSHVTVYGRTHNFSRRTQENTLHVESKAFPTHGVPTKLTLKHFGPIKAWVQTNGAEQLGHAPLHTLGWPNTLRGRSIPGSKKRG